MITQNLSLQSYKWCYTRSSDTTTAMQNPEQSDPVNIVF